MSSGIVTAWRPTPGAVCLDRRCVHVWRCCTALGASQLARYAARLDEAERERLRRLRHRERRHEFVVAHGLLRRELGRAMGCDPTGLEFEVGAHGKPAAAQTWVDPSITFNLSHTAGQVLVAIGCAREIGVDIERCRDELDWTSLATRYFSPAECSALEALPRHRRRAGFFACWSRKEALVKAHGGGIGLELASFDVSVDPDAEPAVLGLRGATWAGRQWRLVGLDVAPGYHACLAVEGGDVEVCCWDA